MALDPPPEFDPILMSRQLYAIGSDAQRRLSSASVLISGMGGLGVEIAKNLILSGVGSVTIHDQQITTISDLASNFYLTSESVGQNRATATFQKLVGLNPSVRTCVSTSNLTDDFLSHFDCVVITDRRPESELKRISTFCHTTKNQKRHQIKFILTETRGVFGYLFVDAGDAHAVLSRTGMSPSRVPVLDITQEQMALVRPFTDDSPRIQQGDWIWFDGVEGMTALNGECYRVIEVLEEGVRIACNTSGFPPYDRSVRFGHATVDSRARKLAGIHAPRVQVDRISHEQQVVVSTTDVHGFSGGDCVTFCDVDSTLDRKHWDVVEVLSENRFRINLDGRGLGEISHGIVRQVVPEKIIRHLPFDAVIRCAKSFLLKPLIIHPSGSVSIGGRFIDKGVVLAFLSDHRILENAQQSLIEAAHEINQEIGLVSEVDESLLREFARESGAIIAPACAIFGGIAAHEVLKVLIKKYMPVSQFAAGAFLAALPRTPCTFTLRNDRYDPYRIVFGEELQDVIERLRYFVVGAGAIGCELLKNFAMMGIATRDAGCIFVTDMDRIERSNLSRQFLFRDSDIGLLKSDVARRSAIAMNPDIRLESHSSVLGKESLHIFHDEFYESLSGVCNAVDNYEARLFSSERCQIFGIPLLNSGTGSTMATMTPIIPHITEGYDIPDVLGDDDAPSCTIHAHPTTIVHTTGWAFEIFNENFTEQPQDVNSFLRDDKDLAQLRRDEPEKLARILRVVEDYLVTDPMHSFDDCIRWARIQFEKLFNFSILDLQRLIPADHLDENQPDWSPDKIRPRCAKFDPKNPHHSSFVTAAAILRARLFSIPAEDWIVERAAAIEVPAYVPSSQGSEEIRQRELIDLSSRLRRYIGSRASFHVEEFEKDVASNHHMEFIAAAANIRAVNFRIEPQDEPSIRRIAGKIAPVLATTTATICGFVALELYKVHSIERRDLADFTAVSIDLADCTIVLGAPFATPTQICPANGQVFSIWTHWRIEGDRTLQELLSELNERFGVTPSRITLGEITIYPPESQAFLDRMMSDLLVNEWEQNPLGKGQHIISLDVMGRSGSTIFLTPKLLFRLP
jgi:ubiquitin-activating enzyme E1